MIPRLKGRLRQAASVCSILSDWAANRADVDGLLLIGSYARETATMSSDVDLVLLTTSPQSYLDGAELGRVLGRGSNLIREAEWGPLAERRFRLRSGLVVEVGVALPAWASAPLDAGTARVLRDGHRILFDPRGICAEAVRTI